VRGQWLEKDGVRLSHDSKIGWTRGSGPGWPWVDPLTIARHEV